MSQYLPPFFKLTGRFCIGTNIFVAFLLNEACSGNCELAGRSNKSHSVMTWDFIQGFLDALLTVFLSANNPERCQVCFLSLVPKRQTKMHM